MQYWIMVSFGGPLPYTAFRTYDLERAIEMYGKWVDNYHVSDSWIFIYLPDD